MTISWKGPLAGELEATEEYGALQSLRVRFLADTDHAEDNPGNVSEWIEEILGDSSIPQFGDVPAHNKNVVCVRREVSMVLDDVGRYFVDIFYEPVSKFEGGWVIRFSDGITTEQRARDITGQLITVEHTYADDHPYKPGFYDIQNCVVEVERGTAEIEAIGIQRTSNPIIFMGNWKDVTNLKYWCGGSPGKWKIQSVVPELINRNTSPPTYKFHVRFQYKSSGWNPTVSYIDQDEGRPPDDLVDGVGVKIPQMYWAKDFNTIWPDPFDYPE